MNDMTVEPVDPTNANTKSSLVIVIATQKVPIKIPMVMARYFEVEGGDIIFTPFSSTGAEPNDRTLSSEFRHG